MHNDERTYDDSYQDDGHAGYGDERHSRWGQRGGWGRGVGDRFFDFIRTRRADHWVMFLAGAFIGALLG